uniref:SGNH hydrolase-type esterase domain-containing protein n=1 Tax=Acanthochromis polyacanthus TaxID=80966 RepID=A0A3Q1EY37_9TELE
AAVLLYLPASVQLCVRAYVVRHGALRTKGVLSPANNCSSAGASGSVAACPYALRKPAALTFTPRPKSLAPGSPGRRDPGSRMSPVGRGMPTQSATVAATSEGLHHIHDPPSPPLNGARISHQPAPKTVIIGDSIIRRCTPHSHNGCDSFLHAGPVPTLGRGIGRFSRLLSLHTWLSTACRNYGIAFIDNFNLLWKRKDAFYRDGVHLNPRGSWLHTSADKDHRAGAYYTSFKIAALAACALQDRFQGSFISL